MIQTEPDVDGDHRDGKGGEDIEHEAGQKCGTQGRHRVPAVALGLPANDLGLPVRPSVDPQRRQPCDEIEEVAGEPREHLVLPLMRRPVVMPTSAMNRGTSGRISTRMAGLPVGEKQPAEHDGRHCRRR